MTVAILNPEFEKVSSSPHNLPYTRGPFCGETPLSRQKRKGLSGSTVPREDTAVTVEQLSQGCWEQSQVIFFPEKCFMSGGFNKREHGLVINRVMHVDIFFLARSVTPLQLEPLPRVSVPFGDLACSAWYDQKIPTGIPFPLYSEDSWALQ